MFLQVVLNQKELVFGEESRLLFQSGFYPFPRIHSGLLCPFPLGIGTTSSVMHSIGDWPSLKTHLTAVPKCHCDYGQNLV